MLRLPSAGTSQRQLQTRYFEAEVSIKLAEFLQFELKAKLQVQDPHHLENADFYFEGQLELKVLTAIREGILAALKALEEWADKSIDEAKSKIEERLAELRSQLAEKERKLKKLKQESHKEVLKRRKVIDNENKILREANEEIEKYEKLYKAAKSKKDSKESQTRTYEQKRDAAQA